VETSSFAPEFGRAPGGQISISTRSGTNELHGSAFNYFRNDALDANNWFANAAGLPRAPERQNDFGGVLGGPILRNKTFFFFSYEGLRLRQPNTGVVNVPSLAVRAAAIPSAAPYLNAYPKPNGPVDPSDPSIAQFTGSFSNPMTLNATSVRVDHVIANKFNLFGRYNYAPSNSKLRVSSLNDVATLKSDTQTLTVGATMPVRSNLTASFRGNYSIQKGSTSQALDSFGGAVPIPLNQLFPSPLSPSNDAGAFSPDDLGQQYEVGSGGNIRESQFNLLGDMAAAIGAHQVKFGFDYRQLNQNNAHSMLAFFEPSTVQGFAASATADSVTGDLNKGGGLTLRSVSLYGQDTWKIGQRLTFTYGLRWEFNPAPSAGNGTTIASWMNVDNPQQLNIAPNGTPLWHNTYANFAPRVGIAYKVTSRGDLVVRGGGGVFYDLGTGLISNLLVQFPNVGFVTATSVSLPLASATAQCGNPPQPQCITPSLSAQPPFPDGVLGFSPDLKLPRSYQWNVAVEKSLWGAQALSLTYVGQVGRRLLRQEGFFQPNAIFQGDFDLTKNGDTSDYHALQVQFRRPVSKRLQVLLDYTWSHSIDTNSSDALNVNAGTVIPERADRGSSAFDVRQNFAGAVTYEIPAAGRNTGLRAITRDWAVDTVVQARTGFPFNAATRGGPAVPGVVTNLRPDRVSGVPVWLSDPSAPGGQHINPGAFSVPQQARQGTESRDDIRGFGLTQVDLSVRRKFPLSERLSLQFRADAFNVLNHPNFTNPTPFLFGLPGGTTLFFLGTATHMANTGLGGLNPLYQIGGPRSLQLSLKLSF